MATYSVYNIKVDNGLYFNPGPTAGYVLGINADGSTSWVQGGGGGGGSQTLEQTLALGNQVGTYSIVGTYSGSGGIDNRLGILRMPGWESGATTAPMMRFYHAGTGSANFNYSGNFLMFNSSSTPFSGIEMDSSSAFASLNIGAFSTQSSSKILLSTVDGIDDIRMIGDVIRIGDSSLTNTIIMDKVNGGIIIDAPAVSFSANPTYSVSLSQNTYLVGITGSVLATDVNGKIIATSSAGTLQQTLALGNNAGTYSIILATGSATDTAIRFAGQTSNTGIYSNFANEYMFLSGGNRALWVSNTKVIFNENANTPAAPPITFGTDYDTGIYRPSANNLAIAAGGATAAIFNASGIVIPSITNSLLAVNSSGQIVASSPTGQTIANIQTTNNTQTSMVDINFGTYSAYSIEANILGFDSTNFLCYGSKIYAVAKAMSPTYSIVNTTDVSEKTDFLTATSDIVVSGSTMSIVVTGETGKTIDWQVQYNINKK